MEGFEPPTS